MDELWCSFDDPFFIFVFFFLFVLSPLVSFHANSLQNSKVAYIKKKLSNLILIFLIANFLQQL
jgi:hypothetical protein